MKDETAVEMNSNSTNLRIIILKGRSHRIMGAVDFIYIKLKTTPS